MEHGPELIQQYFPNLSDAQQAQFAQLGELYAHWNQQINVISRKDIDLLYERHVLHSMGIALAKALRPGMKVLDIGTGGGFPGIPLAIFYPNTEFHLVDSIGKKIKVVQAVADALELKNVTATHERAEKVAGSVDYITARAVTKTTGLLDWSRGKINPHGGLLLLKGMGMDAELNEALKKHHYWVKQKKVMALADTFTGEFFETKGLYWLKSKRGDV